MRKDASSASIVKGVAEGCLQSDAALIGGETAEQKIFYNEEFDPGSG